MNTVTFTYPIAPKSIGGFEIDAFVVEKYKFANKMTSIPVDEGASISDHVFEEPDTISIEAFIGNVIFQANSGRMPSDLSRLQPNDPKTRIRQAYMELLRLKREKQPVDLVTGLDTFEDMVILQLSIDRDVATGLNLPFTMKFKKAIKAGAEATEIHASAREQAGRTADMGPSGRETAQREPWASREAYERWKATGSPTSEEFSEIFGMSPQQFGQRFGG
jgi:hypothetical protein